MDLTDIMKELGIIADCPAAEDVYSGKAERYITFTYEDERATAHADNERQLDTVWMQVNYYVPITYRYQKDKKAIKEHLEQIGAKEISVRSWTEGALDGRKDKKHIVFEFNYSEWRNNQ